VTGSKINAVTAHAHSADIVVAKAAENGVVGWKLPYLCRKMAAPKSNMALDFKQEVVVWSKLRMRSEKSPR